ncbi:MAG: type II toxin-antitoxin system VapC family toxin [Pseudomonadota bacterium]
MVEPSYLLDTNICLYAILALGEPLRQRISVQDEGALAISTITLAELGVGQRSRPEQEKQFARFLGALQVLPFDEFAARRFADLPFRRGSFGRLIAAHALATGLTLVTNNEHDFADIPDLKFENWTL